LAQAAKPANASEPPEHGPPIYSVEGVGEIDFQENLVRGSGMTLRTLPRSVDGSLGPQSGTRKGQILRFTREGITQALRCQPAPSEEPVPGAPPPLDHRSQLHSNFVHMAGSYCFPEVVTRKARRSSV